MKITSKPLRILAMVGIGIVLALIFYVIGLPQKSNGPLTGGILFFVWMWLGGGDEHCIVSLSMNTLT